MNRKGLDPQEIAAVRERISFLKELVDRFGPEVLEIFDRRSRNNIVPEWKAIAERQPSASIETLVDVLWNKMGREAGFEFTIEQTANKTQMRCTYCPWVEVANAAGSTEIGYHILCLSDPHMVEGFNQAASPNGQRIQFSRRKTLMQGDDCCDHCYQYV